MASDLVRQIATLPHVSNNFFHRLAEGWSILLARTLLEHIMALDELILVVLLALCSRGTQ